MTCHICGRELAKGFEPLCECPEEMEALREAVKQFQFAYPYDPPCHNWEPKALAHRLAKQALSFK